MKKCLAFTRFGAPCPEPPASGSKWCITHEELQGKCLRIYKHHSRELDRYAVENPYLNFRIPADEPHVSQPRTHITAEMIPDASHVAQVDDQEALRAWYQIARRTWALANRAVLAREHHHSQFYQHGDDSHRHFNEILRHKQDVLEQLMSAIDQKLFELTIGAEEAEWLLPEKSNESSSAHVLMFSCDELADSCSRDGPTTLETPFTPPSSPTPCQQCESVSEDPDEKLYRKKKTVIGQLMNYLDFPQTSFGIPLEACQELQEIIRNIFRRIIVRDAGLFVRAKEFDPSPSSGSGLYPENSRLNHEDFQCPIKAFINSDRLSLKELERLWGLMKLGKDKIGPELIRNSIADIYRDPIGNDAKQKVGTNNVKKSAKIWILGGYVWRKAQEGPLIRSGCDYLHALVGCAGCMLSVCRTFEEWIENRRLAFVGYRYDAWAEPQEQPFERLFRCLRIVVCRHNCHSKRYKVEKIVPKSKKLKTVYTETQERHFLQLCMSLADPRVDKIINALHMQTTLFNLFAVRRDTGEITHRPASEDGLWCSRIRSGYSAVERKTKRFTPASAFKADKHLFRNTLCSPETAFKHRFNDCWDVLIMDAKAGDFQSFIASIEKVALQVIGFASIKEALINEQKQELVIKGKNDSTGLFAVSSSPTLSSSNRSTFFSKNAIAGLQNCRLLFKDSFSKEIPGANSRNDKSAILTSAKK
ncbi:hypothetical protein O181_015871 [Austropuccinia psidii MF-1]|uniref:Uncharacterized protein n=1 Tax=Austropuccinia psidii MF-1 TaxID=1389203 RepID=A0A9Q3GQI3_9BASI|nr:hypothetical protein [Austropuccinia psidii MF-1]